ISAALFDNLSPVDRQTDAREDGPSPRPDTLDVNRPSFILVIAAGALALFLCRAGAMPLTDPDEGRYALIARQMATSGDWLVPRLFGLPYLEKPPLLYWITAAIFRVFGAFELTARLGPALAAAFGVAATGWFCT